MHASASMLLLLRRSGNTLPVAEKAAALLCDKHNSSSKAALPLPFSASEQQAYQHTILRVPRGCCVTPVAKQQ
jgi:hypothetical protein